MTGVINGSKSTRTLAYPIIPYQLPPFLCRGTFLDISLLPLFLSLEKVTISDAPPLEAAHHPASHSGI